MHLLARSYALDVTETADPEEDEEQWWCRSVCVALTPGGRASIRSLLLLRLGGGAVYTVRCVCVEPWGV